MAKVQNGLQVKMQQETDAKRLNVEAGDVRVDITVPFLYVSSALAKAIHPALRSYKPREVAQQVAEPEPEQIQQLRDDAFA